MSEKDMEQLVARVFVELGAEPAAKISNTLFLEGGRCLAIAYHAGHLSAVWSFADRTLEFRDSCGMLLRSVVVPDDILPPVVAA